jgi:L-lactate dehydrogenase complex protein LldF
VLLRLLARSATGQEITSYTTFFTGPRHAGDADGPAEFHVVLVDNGRSNLLGGAYHDMLRCIRCGACLNHCPVYGAIGGHAYGWVYPGPMGAVLTPLMIGLRQGKALPDASTLCGRCEEVCPMSIPLPQLLREHRRQAFERRLTPPRSRWALGVWAFVARRPALYRLASRVGVWLLKRLSGGRGRLSKLPFAAGWTAARDLPAPQGETFMAQWQRRRTS